MGKQRHSIVTIQDCIKLLCETYRWTYEGSFIQGERRYRFTLEDSNTITFNTRSVRSRAGVAQAYKEGCKWATALHS